MIIEPLTRQEEVDLTVGFKNDLVLALNEAKKEMLNRIKDASTPQEALSAINVLDEPLEEE